MPDQTKDPIPPTTTPRPTSPRRAEASRINGAKSRGPKTPAGKATSSINAATHGLTASVLTLERESNDRFAKLLQDFENELKPQSDVESGLVTTMALARWRTTRIWNIEKAVLDIAIEHEIDNHAATGHTTNAQFSADAFHRLADGSRVLAMIDRCENRYQRHFTRAFRDLLALRTHRRQEEKREQALEEQAEQQRQRKLEQEREQKLNEQRDRKWEEYLETCRRREALENAPRAPGVIENAQTNPTSDTKQTTVSNPYPANPALTRQPSGPVLIASRPRPQLIPVKVRRR
jgi:hypothetical protein